MGQKERKPQWVGYDQLVDDLIEVQGTLYDARRQTDLEIVQAAIDAIRHLCEVVQMQTRAIDNLSEKRP